MENGRNEIDSVRLDGSVENRPGPRIGCDGKAELKLHQTFLPEEATEDRAVRPRSLADLISRSMVGRRPFEVRRGALVVLPGGDDLDDAAIRRPEAQG